MHKHFRVNSNYSHLSNKHGGGVKNQKCGKASSVHQNARLERQWGFPEESLPSQSRLKISNRCTQNFGLIPTHIVQIWIWMKKNRALKGSEAFLKSPCLAKADWRLTIDAQINSGRFLAVLFACLEFFPKLNLKRWFFLVAVQLIFVAVIFNYEKSHLYLI